MHSMFVRIARPRRARIVAVLAAMLASAPAFAGDTPVAPPAAVPAEPTPVSACHCAPAGTPIVVEITESLVSDERKPGDGFALKLAEPVLVDGTVAIPAGTPGHGEIVHAAKAHGGGQPGELLLAARYLDLDGRRIPLRGMKLGAAGADHSAASLATSMVAGPFALFIHGGEMVIPPGTRATAKLAAAIDAATTPTSTPVAAPAAAPTPSTPETP